jgi:hypothetical protein
MEKFSTGRSKRIDQFAAPNYYQYILCIMNSCLHQFNQGKESTAKE